MLLLELGEPFGVFCLHAAVELSPAVVGGLRYLQYSAGVCDGLALGKQLVSRSLLRRSLRLELADDLLECVTGAFHGGVPGPVWPDEDSHSPWTDFQGPGHLREETVSRGNRLQAKSQ